MSPVKVTFLFSIIFIIFTCYHSTVSKPYEEDRIVGGNFTNIKLIPYIVSVTMTDELIHNCGGSIIDSNIILTAAHCTQFEEQHLKTMKIRAGSKYSDKDGEIISVSQIIDHESYDSVSKDFDVSILILSENLVYTDSIQPIKLADERYKSGTIARVSGWGYESLFADDISTELKTAFVPITNWKKCKKNYELLTENQLCAGKTNGDDACTADSGGPLVVDDKLIGIVSYGNGCGIGGVYTDICSLYKFNLTH
ncbi:trypsin-1-like [Condylostylus longicornis]|uniref:trypsin-1-like n=1 Tax=Condylostylus longicornis TaxID=2530218 RepID=UPI00244E2391|nr:trypsin-1-like [Condylostylus longicornis]